jgi:hypothetical protein
MDGADDAGNMETIEVNAPTRFHVAGTWVAGDTIQVFIQKGQQVSSYTYTVVQGRTQSFVLALDFVLNWNANSDSFCKTITASIGNNLDEIMMNGTSAWGGVIYPVVNSASGTFVNQAVVGNPPGSALLIDGNNIILENYKIRNPNGQAGEGITVTGAYPSSGSASGGNVTIQNCDIRDSWFGIAIRSYGATIENCVMYNAWPFLVESGATNNTIRNCTLYSFPSTENVGAITYEGSISAATSNQFYNNICVADSTLTNMGTGALPAYQVYCIFDWASAAGDAWGGTHNTYLENNCYWTIGANATLGSVANVNCPTLASLQSTWQAAGVNTRSSLNDRHSIYADPQFVDANDGDFSLLPSSPCIGAGMPYIGGDNSFIGAVPPKADR